MTPETVYSDRELYIVTNEDGDITADADRDTAIGRMSDDYGGHIYRVYKLVVRVPRPRDYLANIILREEDGEGVDITVVNPRAWQPLPEWQPLPSQPLPSPARERAIPLRTAAAAPAVSAPRAWQPLPEW